MKILGMIFLGGLILGTLYYNNVSGKLSKFECGQKASRTGLQMGEIDKAVNGIVSRTSNLKNVKVVSERF